MLTLEGARFLIWKCQSHMQFNQKNCFIVPFTMTEDITFQR